MLRLALHWQILIGMVLGAGAGVLLNVTAGQRTAASPEDASPAWKIVDSRDRIEITLGEGDEARRLVVDAGWDESAKPADGAKGVRRFSSLSELSDSEPRAYRLFQDHGRSLARRVGDAASALGGLFLRMLKMVAIPLIVTSLVSGVVGLGSSRGVGGMFGRTLTYYVVTSLLAICTGLAAVNIIRPGDRGGDAAPAAEASAEGTNIEGESLGEVLWGQLENLIPENPFAALAGGEFLSIIAFSLMFAATATIIGGQTLTTVKQFAEAGFEVMMRLTMAIIQLAPIGVLFMMLAATASQGVAVFAALSWYMIAVAVALAVHAVVTLPLIVYFFARRNPWEYARSMSPALLTAFSSASSNGTLPLTITCVETRAGIDNRISSFVLPLGATVNMDGTALYEAVAVLFIAQLTPEVNFTFTQQIIVVFTALLASIGAAGIPHAGLVMMVIILQAVGLPTEKQALIIAVDRVLDMARTCVNVWSDSCGCAVVERYTKLEPVAIEDEV